ncbi:antitoxin VbhA family protein [Clostridium paridis]|uniref:Antitoxin VbhA family protein n=1 Tax=Clostridium paridis TaxID=2803863 RepID=A0A937FB42_9CLOT|nr:antitoxin VbhA family protein [Clostridium paridis]MBL4930669.1 antitoxin VbhA family protein [Clostridium paridis]
MKDIEQVIKNVKATLAMEGLKVNQDIEDIGRKVLNGELTGDKAVEIIKEKYLYKECDEEIDLVKFERTEKYL